MKKTAIIVLLAILTALPAAAETYENEIKAIQQLTSIMNEFADSIDTAENDDDYISACNMFAEGLENLKTFFMEMMEQHPEWGENPPAELAKHMTALMNATMRFTEIESKLMEYANSNTQNELLQKAFERLNEAMM